MKPFEPAFGIAAARINSAARKTISEYEKKIIPDEPALTAALVTRIKDSLETISRGGISWDAKILSSHGPNTEESKFGADLLGVLNINLPGYSIRKGFLAQAKRQEPGKSITKSEWNRLRIQCGQMLMFSSASYIFVYSLHGVFVVPAISVMACADVEDLFTLLPKKLSAFYKEHFKCFVGDSKLDRATDGVLVKLFTRIALELSATEADLNDRLTKSDGNA